MSLFFAEFKLAPCSQTEDRIVYDSCETLYEGEHGTKLYRESYAPRCWLPFTKPVPFRLGHGTGTVGHVSVVIDHGKWHVGTAVIEEGPLNSIARDRIKPGARISLGGRSLRRYENSDLRLVRHTVVRLDEVALVGDNEIEGLPGAVITHIHEPKPKPKPAVQPATRRTAAAVPAAPPVRGDRFLSEHELQTLIYLGREMPVDVLARLIGESGERDYPDPSLGMHPYYLAKQKAA